MSDTYQAVYDAVRSQLRNTDVGAAVESAIRGTCDASFAIENVAQSFHAAANAQRYAADQSCRPFVLLRPKIYPDGNMWCALYGDDLMAGVAGFGETPEKAAAAFDIEWTKAKP